MRIERSNEGLMPNYVYIYIWLRIARAANSWQNVSKAVVKENSSFLLIESIGVSQIQNLSKHEGWSFLARIVKKKMPKRNLKMQRIGRTALSREWYWLSSDCFWREEFSRLVIKESRAKLIQSRDFSSFPEAQCSFIFTVYVSSKFLTEIFRVRC